MTSAQVVETSVIVNNNSSFQNYTNPDDHTQQTSSGIVLRRSKTQKTDARGKKVGAPSILIGAPPPKLFSHEWSRVDQDSSTYKPYSLISVII